MRISLGYWWPFARTAWGWIVASAAGLAAVYYGPKKMLETFDWYMNRFRDYKVRDYLESLVIVSHLANAPAHNKAEVKSVQQIAAATHLSEKRVTGCLKRLRNKGDVKTFGQNGWRANVSS
jgi:hypothetical protein